MVAGGRAGAARRLVAPALRRWRVLPAVAALVCSSVALVRMSVLIDFATSDGDAALWAVELAAAISAALAGGWLVQRSPADAAGWLLQLASVALALSALTDTGAVLPGSGLVLGSATVTVQLWANLLGRVLLLAAAVVSLPDRVVAGRVGGGPGTAALAALVVGVTAGVVLQAQPGDLRDTPFGFGNQAWIDAAAAVPSGVFLTLLAVHVVSLVLLAHRRGGADPTLFQVVGWALAAATLPAAFPVLAARLPTRLVDVLATVVVPTLPVISVLALLRALSWTVNRLVSRTIVWASLSVGVLVIQATAVAVAALTGGRFGFVASVAASLVAAAGFQAARRRVQSTVDRIVYGTERDPAVAVAELGRRMEGSLGPDDVLPDLASAVAAAFGGGVVVELGTSTGLQEVARAGSFDDRGHEHRWPLVHQGERIGVLTARAPATAPYRAADLAALGQLAAQAAVAAHGVRTSLALRRSQTELVVAVEDERRRLQRELHDGLGPTLAGVALGIRAARNQLTAATGDPERLLTRLTDEVEASVEEVRRIVHDLRPAALDQLGLVEAVRAWAERCTTTDLAVVLEVEGPLPPLSAAAEVAAYRIVLEAVTNVVRHAGASTCAVRLRADHSAVVVEVEDDGAGLGAEVVPGLGLSSMRERSTGVGGDLLVTVGAQGGTRVVASLPTEVCHA